MGWSTKDIPDQNGKVVVVTGANGGLGLVTCRELAAKGATVVMACRNLAKGEAARADILRDHANAKLIVRELDLADLASVHRFVAGFHQAHAQLDLLINNAGIIGMPRRKTKDGFELQMGVDCLGHFALTGLLLDSLRQAPAARVVSVGTSSQPQKSGRIDLDDLNWERRRYRSLAATLQAKLSVQVLTFELERRLRENGIGNVCALVAHPGIAETNVAVAGAVEAKADFKRFLLGIFNQVFTQSAAAGALPQLYAATSPAAQGGDFIGPGGPFEMWGAPKHLRAGSIMHDEVLADGLWQRAEALTQVAYLSQP